jgi:hypothetical protein
MKRRCPRTTTALGAAALALPLAALLGADARASAPPGRYEITTNGTPDDFTDDTVLDVKTQLRWQRTFSGDVTWDPNAGAGSAQAYCAALTVGTYTTGWRLPTIKELLTIVDPRSHPAFDTKVFPGIALSTESGNSRRFWSATPAAGAAPATSAWAVGRGAGHAQTWSIANKAVNVARCVRSP